MTPGQTCPNSLTSLKWYFRSSVDDVHFCHHRTCYIILLMWNHSVFLFTDMFYSQINLDVRSFSMRIDLHHTPYTLGFNIYHFKSFLDGLIIFVWLFSSAKSSSSLSSLPPPQKKTHNDSLLRSFSLVNIFVIQHLPWELRYWLVVQVPCWPFDRSLDQCCIDTGDSLLMWCMLKLRWTWLVCLHTHMGRPTCVNHVNTSFRLSISQVKPHKYKPV